MAGKERGPGVTEVGPASVDLRCATAGLEPGQWVPVDPAVAAALPPDCLLAGLGIVPTHVGRGACRAEMTVTRGHLNQRGVAQAGALVSFADAAAGWAAYTAVASGRFTTLELSCNLLRAAVAGDELVAEASPVHLGRRTLVIEVVIRRADKAVARFTCTQLVLDEPGARS
jgi:uncharacterized protein (TIGR00369 family)